MKIDLSPLAYTFQKKPIVVGGKAMEYYELRKSGQDTDLIAHEQDIVKLIKQYPDKVKDLYSDLGVCPFDFEIWRSIMLLKYEDLFEGAIEEEDYFIISLEKLLFMKSLGMHEPKLLEDTKLLVKKITDTQYANYEEETARIQALLKGTDVTYLEKTGP